MFIEVSANGHLLSSSRYKKTVAFLIALRNISTLSRQLFLDEGIELYERISKTTSPMAGNS